MLSPAQGRHADRSRRTRATRAALLLTALLAGSGCSTVRGWFGSDDDDKPTKPSELTEFASTATVTRVAQWLRHGEGGYRAVLDRAATA